jgi:hypothetical protein
MILPRMTEKSGDALLFGQVLTDLPPHELADSLRRAGIDARVRESSLRVGGTYLRVEGEGDADCSLERGSAPGEWMVHDAGGEHAALEGMAAALSAALIAMDVPHRLELYAGENELAASFAYGWPGDAG